MDLKTEQKKWRFPLFDFALLLLLVLVVIAGAYWAMHRGKTPTEELVCTVRFSGVENTYSGTFSEGMTIYTASGEALGVIRSAAVSRALEASFDADTAEPDANGVYAYTYTRSDQRSDILLTIQVTAEARDGGYFVGETRVAAGIVLDVMTVGYRGEGSVLTLAHGEVQEGDAE